ncbi:MAG: response regulator transcription factor [Christensenellales bacterium]|jgi:two-component system response regulator YesN
MYKLMMVDDQQRIMEGIVQIIRQSDLPFSQFHIAESGMDALECMGSFSPDAVIADIRMPEMDGLQFIERVRSAGGEGRRVPIIILSGYDEFEYARKAISSGVISYLLKPVSSDELYNALRQVCDMLAERTEREASGIDHRPYVIRAALNGTQMDGEWGEEGPFLLAQLIPARMDASFQREMQRFVETYKENLRSVYEREGDVLCLVKGAKLSYARIFPKATEVNVSLPIKNLAGLSQALKQVRLVHLRRSVISRQTVVSYSDISSSDRVLSMVHFADLRRVTDAISQGNAAKLATLLAEINAKLMRQEATLEHVCAYYSSMCMELYKRYFSITLLELLSEEFDFFLHSASLLAEFTGIERISDEVLRNLRSLCEKLPVHKTDNLVLAAKEYVASHPQVNLAELAEKLHISSQYLSSRFNKETGRSFSSFLIEKRMEAAKNLLESTARPVSDIGRSVGYLSDKHFYVVFKKIVGDSPAKYRQRMRAKKFNLNSGRAKE